MPAKDFVSDSVQIRGAKQTSCAYGRVGRVNFADAISIMVKVGIV